MATALPVHRQNKGGTFFLDLTTSQISPTYARCLANMIEAQKGCPRGTCDLRSPRPRTSFSIRNGTDSNALSHQAILAATELSPRGFRVDGWTLYEKKRHEPCTTFPRQGTFEKRASESKERKYFPNIIRKDKAQQEILERGCYRWAAIQVMEIEQEEYMKGKKIEKRNERLRASEEKYERNLTRRIARERLVAEDVKKKTEQARIQQEIDAMASDR